MTDPDAAAFVATHARLLDRHRFAFLFEDGPAEPVLAALAAYANPDGGFGWALEPDQRSPTSQPVGALHALEILEELAPATSPLAGRVCDWLQAASLRDGGLPFSVAGAAGPGTAPWFAGADPHRSSLHITAAICSAAHRLARHDGVVAAHPWLESATAYCRADIASQDRPGHAYELRYSLWLLDALGDEAGLRRLAAFVPASGALPVEGGIEGEALHPLDLCPWPGGPLRGLLDDVVIETDLDRLSAQRLPDGGWDVDFQPGSPAAALEWRGHATIAALAILQAHGRVIS